MEKKNMYTTGLVMGVLPWGFLGDLNFILGMLGLAVQATGMLLLMYLVFSHE